MGTIMRTDSNSVARGLILATLTVALAVSFQPRTASASGVAEVVAGDRHTCALMTIGGARCWGDNEFGQVGDGTTLARHTPVDVSGLMSGAAAVSAGAFHACALTNVGGVKCWGDNALGKLGDGTMAERHAPVDVSGLTSGSAAPPFPYFTPR